MSRPNPNEWTHPYNKLGAIRDAAFPATWHDDGQAITARIAIPTLGGSYVVEESVRYAPYGTELGFGKYLKKAFKKTKEVAKKVAKNKAFQTAVKTAPIWANVIPPPAGQAIAAGAAAGLAAAKIVQAAKKGHKNAKKFLDDAKAERTDKKKTLKKALLVKGKLGKKNPALAAKVVATLANKTGHYTVQLPSGKTVRVPASKVT